MTLFPGKIPIFPGFRKSKLGSDFPLLRGSQELQRLFGSFSAGIEGCTQAAGVGATAVGGYGVEAAQRQLPRLAGGDGLKKKGWGKYI